MGSIISGEHILSVSVISNTVQHSGYFMFIASVIDWLFIFSKLKIQPASFLPR